MNENHKSFLINQLKQGRSLTHGILHIPKTGGTSLADTLKALAKDGHTIPIKFPHGWRARNILEASSKTRICCLIRDPIDRAISGFNSRLRQGRPRYDNLWTVGEAVSFSFFSSGLEMIDGLAAEDDRTKSAALFALHNITHLKYNYEYYFEGPEYIDTIKSQIGIVENMSDYDRFCDRLFSEINIPLDTTSDHRRHSHKAPVKQSSGELSPKTLDTVRTIMEKEYEIFGALEKLAG